MSRTKATQEHRRYPRIARTLRIRVVRGTEQLATETVNVSCGGALCRLAHPLPLMTKVAVALALPKRLVHCTGVVVRCRPAPPRRYQAALFFTNLARDDHRALAEFILGSMFTRAAARR